MNAVTSHKEGFVLRSFSFEDFENCPNGSYHGLLFYGVKVIILH